MNPADLADLSKPTNMFEVKPQENQHLHTKIYKKSKISPPLLASQRNNLASMVLFWGVLGGVWEYFGGILEGFYVRVKM